MTNIIMKKENLVTDDLIIDQLNNINKGKNRLKAATLNGSKTPNIRIKQ